MRYYEVVFHILYKAYVLQELIAKYSSFVVHTEPNHSSCFSTAHLFKNYQIDVLNILLQISACQSVFLSKLDFFGDGVHITHGGFGMEVLIELIQKTKIIV